VSDGSCRDQARAPFGLLRLIRLAAAAMAWYFALLLMMAFFMRLPTLPAIQQCCFVRNKSAAASKEHESRRDRFENRNTAVNDRRANATDISRRVRKQDLA
jgi:hypothetical protein